MKAMRILEDREAPLARCLAIIERTPHDFDVIVTDFAMPLVSGSRQFTSREICAPIGRR